MERKSLVLIIVTIIVFSFVFLTYSGINQQTLQVGEINYKIPEGYKYIGLNEHGSPTLTNGLDSIYFTYYNDTNISHHVKEHIDECKSKNRTVVLSNFTVNDIFVYKTVNSKNSNHFWFVCDNKTYSFFTWKETFNMDDIARSLISSST